MINFFRRLRRKFATENKPLKYLRYAIGEILLVVIGILLALQLNTWHEQNKLRAEEQYLLKELLEEFNTNLGKIKEDQYLNTNNQNAAFEILKMIHDQSMRDKPEKLDSLFMVVFSYGSFNAATGTLNEIISSGKLRVIKDKALRTMLTQWPGWIENQEEDIEIRKDQINNHVEPFFVKYAPFRNSDTYLDFSHWSTRYKRDALEASNFNYDFEALKSREFEGILYKFCLDQDFVLLNDMETQVFIENTIQQININIK